MTHAASRSTGPTWRFVWSHPAHVLAFGLGSGLAPAAPGTVGTLLALPLYWYLGPRLDAVEFLLLIVLLFVVGVWACGRTGRVLGVADHGGIVWDEIVAFLAVLFFTPDDLRWQAAAFVLFRVFDVAKPPPIRYYDERLKSGFGVMFDDMIAAFYTLLALALWKALLESF